MSFKENYASCCQSNKNIPSDRGHYLPLFSTAFLRISLLELLNLIQPCSRTFLQRIPPPPSSPWSLGRAQLLPGIFGLLLALHWELPGDVLPNPGLAGTPCSIASIPKKSWGAHIPLQSPCKATRGSRPPSAPASPGCRCLPWAIQICILLNRKAKDYRRLLTNSSDVFTKKTGCGN